MGAINEAGMNFLGDVGRRITKHTDVTLLLSHDSLPVPNCTD